MSIAKKAPALLLILLPVLALGQGVDDAWYRVYGSADGSGIMAAATDNYADDEGYVYTCGSGSPDSVAQVDMLVIKHNEWGDLMWVGTVDGDQADSSDIAHALTVDSAGNVYIAGMTENTGSGYDATWAKFNSSGDILWSFTPNWVDEDQALDIVIGLNEDVYISGYCMDNSVYLTDFMVARINPADGNTVWVNRYCLDDSAFDADWGAGRKRPGRGQDRLPEFYLDDWWDWDNCATCLAVDPGTGYIVAGGFGLHENRYREMWLMKFLPDGTRSWNVTHHRGLQDWEDVILDVVVHAGGDIYIAGGSEPQNNLCDYTVGWYSSGGSAQDWFYYDAEGSDDFATAICLDDANPPNVYTTGMVNYDDSDFGYEILTHKFSYNLTPRWGGGARFGYPFPNTSQVIDDYGTDICWHDGRVYVSGEYARVMAWHGYTLALCYTDADAAVAKDTLWTYKHKVACDGASAIAVVDTDHVYLAGQVGEPALYNFMYTSRLFYPDPDLRIDAILAPVGLVSPGDTVFPQVRIVNEGNTRALFEVFLTVDGGFDDSIPVTGLLPGDTSEPVFGDTWFAPMVPGTLAVRCSLFMFAHGIEVRDTLMDSVYVVVRDVGCTQIVSPTATVDSGVPPIVPQAWIANFGSAAETFDCWLSIGTFYAETVSVVLVPAAESLLQSFPSWTPLQRGTWTVACSTMLAGDVDDTNDSAMGSVMVRVVDVALLDIVAPTDTVDSGVVVIPQVRLINYGNELATFWTWLTMDDGSDAVVYSESVEVILTPGLDSFVSLPSTDPLSALGMWQTAAWCAVSDDMHPENDSQAGWFFVKPPGITWPPGWAEVEPIPLPPGNKAVKRGAWAAFNEGDELMYVTKGYKTTDFFAYYPLKDSWNNLTGMPYTKHSNPKWARKVPRKGSKGVSDGDNSIYVTQGNNTLGFWRYNILQDSWTELQDVPVGPDRKKVKGGTDLTYLMIDDTGFVYCLKGYRCEFYRYNTETGTWDAALANAPTGKRGKWDKGSWLVAKDTSATTLYAHKAKYNELWSYNVPADSWNDALAGMPFVGMQGRKKKSKDGGSADWYAGDIYALKGGNTNEFWKYRVSRDTWDEIDSMPTMGSTAKKKRVKYGADIVYGLYAFWSLKGNKTREFWRYGLSLDVMDGRSSMVRSGVAGSPVSIRSGWNFAVAPNPLGKGGVLRYSVPYPVPLSLRLYDAVGRAVKTICTGRVLSGTGAIRLDAEGLARGVYLLRIDAGVDARYSLKVVIE